MKKLTKKEKKMKAKKRKDQKRYEDILLNNERRQKHIADYYMGKIDANEVMKRMRETKPKPRLPK